MPPKYIAVPFLSSGGTVTPITDPTITANPVTSSRIDLKIIYSPPPGPLSYSFEQAPAPGGPWTVIASQTSNTFSVTGLTQNTSYSFRGKVQVADGRFSNYSNIATAATLAAAPGQPTGLTVTSTTSNSVSLAWTATPQATSYNIYRNGALLDTNIHSGTTYSDTTVSPSTAYTYTITAVNVAGESAQSAPVTATTGGTSSGVRLPAGVFIYYNASNHLGNNLSGMQALHPTFKNNDAIRGYHMYATWGEMEGDTQGDYSPFDSAVTTIKNTIAGSNKMWSWGLWDRSFGASPPAGQSPTYVDMPQYAVNNGWYVNATPPGSQGAGGLGGVINYANTSCQAALNNLHAHVASKCANDLTFASYNPMGETSIDASLALNQNTLLSYIVNVLMPFLSGVFPNTMLRLQTNYFNNSNGAAALDQIFTQGKNLGNWAFGGPDPMDKGRGFYAPGSTVATNPPPYTTSEKLWRGEISGYAARKGTMPYHGETEQGGQGGVGGASKETSQTALFRPVANATTAQAMQGIMDYMNGLGCQVYLLNYQNSQQIQFTANWLPYFTAHPRFNTTTAPPGWVIV